MHKLFLPITPIWFLVEWLEQVPTVKPGKSVPSAKFAGLERTFARRILGT